jgi:hypothetical protein
MNEIPSGMRILKYGSENDGIKICIREFALSVKNRVYLKKNRAKTLKQIPEIK